MKKIDIGTIFISNLIISIILFSTLFWLTNYKGLNNIIIPLVGVVYLILSMIFTNFLSE